MAAGLIGGRVGNKGGVGVSVNIAGKTLLFVNAHLAGGCYLINTNIFLTELSAHEDRVMSRVANMNKIKVIYHNFEEIRSEALTRLTE